MPRTTLRRLLEKLLGILAADSQQQYAMLKQVDEVIQLKMLDLIFQDLSAEDKRQFEGKSPEEQQKILVARLHPRYTPLQIKEKYMTAAAKTVIPGFIRALLTEATGEERQKAKEILRAVNAAVS